VSEILLAIAGEDVQLLPERALFWPRACTLVVADVHWGKAATFRAAGIPIPGGTTAEDLARLDSALYRTGARRLVVLGDLFHARAGRIATRTLGALRGWRERCARLEIQLVRGNHDRHAGDPPGDLRINCVDSPVFLPPFVLRHEPRDATEGYTLAGHLHPGLVVSGPALQRERLPCFLVRPGLTILPAFGSFTGMESVVPEPADQVFVVADGEVLPIVRKADA
jgi:DNA ligase-associated metallophosphoesterase